MFLQTHVRKCWCGEFWKKKKLGSSDQVMMHLLFCTASRAVSLLHLFLPKIGLLLFTSVTEWSTEEWFPASIQVKSSDPNRTNQHPQSKPRKDEIQALLGLSDWQDTLLLPFCQSSFGSTVLHRPPEGVAWGRDLATYPEGKGPVHPEWP